MDPILFTPANIQVVPFNGFLHLIIDPADTLANPDGAEIVAEIYRCLMKSQGRQAQFTADDLETLIHTSQVPPGKKLMLGWA